MVGLGTRLILKSECHALPVQNLWIRFIFEDTWHVVETEGSEDKVFGLDDGCVQTRPLVFHDAIDQEL